MSNIRFFNTMICRECHDYITNIEYDPYTETFSGHCRCTRKTFRPYINICHECGYKINSLFSEKSYNPEMGYHCERCGEDLTKWKTGISNKRFKEPVANNFTTLREKMDWVRKL